MEYFAALRDSAKNGRGASARPAFLLLHGAIGLTDAKGYRLAARTLAASGYHVAFVHYLDRTEGRCGAYADLQQDLPLWTETIRNGVRWLAAQTGVDPYKLGMVGISLGAALAFATASAEQRQRAIIDYSGPLPDELARRRPRLPPTLILSGGSDRIVPVLPERAMERFLQEHGTTHWVRIYEGQGHGLAGVAQVDAAARLTCFSAAPSNRLTLSNFAERMPFSYQLLQAYLNILREDRRFVNNVAVSL